MEKYAKIIDEKTKQVQVGVGCPDDFYIEIGMTPMEVELAYDGNYYIKGYAPQLPPPTDEELKQREIGELMSFLYQTDYISHKLIEAVDDAELNDLKEKYADVLRQRREARARINELEK